MRTRLEHIRVLFVIGCNDGLLPKRADRGGILSDYDREILKGAGMELALAAREEVFCQQYYLYLLLTKPVSYTHLNICRNQYFVVGSDCIYCMCGRRCNWWFLQ